jgi:CMP-N-acetylneuraminic acid synthetase
MFMSYFALIPARGGSKGIPRKNLAPLGGHPLIGWAIATAQRSRVFEEIVLSSDESEILEAGEKYGATRLIKRPEEIAGDGTKQIEVMKHALRELDKLGTIFEHLVLLQPTAPFRPPNLVSDSITLHRNSNFASVISVTDVTHMNDSTLYGGSLSNLTSIEGKNISTGTLRQTFTRKYWRNGAIYVLNRKDILRNSLYSEKVVGIQMSHELSINIDSTSDLETARNLLHSSIGQEIQEVLFESLD